MSNGSNSTASGEIDAFQRVVTARLIAVSYGEDTATVHRCTHP
jgi:hypothetical protein